MTVRSILFLCLGFIAISGFSQRKKDRDTSDYIYQPNRVEFEVSDFDLDFQIISGEDEGLLVVVETNDRSGGGYNWKFHYLDTLLKVQWTRIYKIDFEHNLAGYEYSDGKFYLLFNTSLYRNEDLLLLEVDSKESTFKEIEINTVFPIQLSFFEVVGDNVIFAGYTNFRPVLLRFNINDERPQVVPGFYDNKSDILDVVIDDEAEMFSVIQSEKMDNKKFTIRAKTFTSTADLIQNNAIEPGDRKNLIDGASTLFYGGFQYVAGTYSKKASQYSRGLYLSKFINGRQQFIKYHEYAKLDNFFGYMNERREKRIKEKIKRRTEKGKRVKFSYRLLVHDIIQRDNEFIMIAEAYYPRYSSYSTAMPYSGYNGYNRLNPSFMGYSYTHAVIVAFDRNGNILWDNSFEINDMETYSLEEFVTVSTYEDNIVLMYLEENEIRSKVINGDEILEGKSFSPVRLSYENDEVKSRNPEIEGLKDWYQNTMYAFGEQRIKNTVLDGERTRKIFYINKIQYHLQENPN